MEKTFFQMIEEATPEDTIDDQVALALNILAGALGNLGHPITDELISSWVENEKES